MKRKTLIWTVIGLSILTGGSLAMSRYSAFAHEQLRIRGIPTPGSLLRPQWPQSSLSTEPTRNFAPTTATPPAWMKPNPPSPHIPAGTPSVYTSPGAHQDEMRVQLLLKEYQSSKEEVKRKELVEQITKTVAHQFEEKQSIRERELKELEERVIELRTTHVKRESLKEKIIADRVQQLINNVDGIGWGNELSNVVYPVETQLGPPIPVVPPIYVPVQTVHQPIPSQPIPRGPYQPIPGQPFPSSTYRPGFLVPRSGNEAPAALQPTESVAPPTSTEPAEPQHGDIAPGDIAPGDIAPGDVAPVAPATELPKEPGL
jgi:hypothetical protein